MATGSNPLSRIEVYAGSRLHFGLLRPTHDGNRVFGGAGMMIDEPTVVIRAEPRLHEQAALIGVHSDRLQNILQRCQTQWPNARCSDVAIQVRQVSPIHSGLGTGTQLALAATIALAHALQISITPETAIEIAGRGRRSAIGVHGFFRGGFLIDGGSQHEDVLGTLEGQVIVPADWRVVLLRSRQAASTVHGSEEESRFSKCPPPRPEVSEHLERLMRTEMFPAISSHDFPRFAQAVTVFNRDAGSLFASVQGGPYHGPVITELVENVQRLGQFGVGQSSWGPTVFALCADVDQADWLLQKLDEEAVEARIVRPLNQPARIVRD